MADRGPIRMMALVEASTVTGPAKNLIEFCRNARCPDPERPDLPLVDPMVVTYVRGSPTVSNAFLAAVADAGLSSHTISESFRFDPRVMPQLRAKAAARNPHVIQTHSVKSHFLLRLSGLHRQYPWIAFHHGYTWPDLKVRAYNQLDRWSLRAARLVVTVCAPFAEELVQAGVKRSKIRILHNSIRLPAAPDPGMIGGLRQKLGLREDEAVILAVGRLSEEKGHMDLISALAELQRFPLEHRLRLVLVGDGPERENLRSAIASRGLSGHVIFVGQVSDVQPYYGLATVLALPSHSEGSPNVILEAMAAGVSIAATAVGGVPELLTHEVNGLLVEPRQPKALASALHRLLSDEALAGKLAQEARSRVAAEFQPGNYRRSLVEVYEEVISHPLAG